MGAYQVSDLILIDTDILIDAARQINEAVDFLTKVERQFVLTISVITHMELLIGCRNKTELRNTDRFLQRFQVIGLNEMICDIALDLLRQYRLSHGLLIPDALIAATAIATNLPLVTKNQRDYRFISGLQLFPYPG
jgi:predicted nucleic acid-binding protein